MEYTISRLALLFKICLNSRQILILNATDAEVVSVLISGFDQGPLNDQEVLQCLSGVTGLFKKYSFLVSQPKLSPEVFYQQFQYTLKNVYLNAIAVCSFMRSRFCLLLQGMCLFQRQMAHIGCLPGHGSGETLVCNESCRYSAGKQCVSITACEVGCV